MGVPKFYRWISERYPCLSEVVKEFQLPEFDNLYLDMNGIIHVCSHPDDDNPHFRITEETIFRNICHYIDFLYRMIKPRKVFFMAVDGVAPRAKMNQQRGRRFRSAREAEHSIQKAQERGETLPTEARFDSNCITPGTPFMVRLQAHLKYFVIDKVTNDPLWQGRRIYLSGHETPGEGEHKVMDFIRYSKSQPDYDPDTRHCLYGLDADLIMLGLVSHEPRFSLLREEVRFGGAKDKNKRPMTPEETTFHLLHLSLLRDYLAYEFSDLKGKLSFEWDMENLIDDWILMGFLVGNDFIPHLPHLHIHHDALPLLWRTYKKVLPSLDGYLNDGGHLNLSRFEQFMIELSKFDMETFESAFSDLSYLEGKLGGKSINESAGASRSRQPMPKMKELKPFKVKQNGNPFAALEDMTSADFVLDDESDDEDDDVDDDDSEETSSEDEDEDESFDTFEDEFRIHKRDYYMSKMAYSSVTPEVIKEQAQGYVIAIQWILLYYYEGCPSWSWFYAHHYAPYISDIRGFSSMKITFELSTPFLPFQQLMAVLPAASKELLPPALQTLMTEESSPVLDFYPVNFDTDLNGKQQDWEAVVLIPFIEEDRLLSAMASRENMLTQEERTRNRHGPHLMYQYHPENQGFYPSSLPGVFPDININKAQLTEIDKHAFHIDANRLRKGLLDRTRLDVYFPGFPTLRFLPHTFDLARTGVKVFQHVSRGENMVLRIQAKEDLSIEKVADELLGKETFVGWPHLHEAKVTAVANESFKIELLEDAGRKGRKEPVVSFNRRRLDEYEAKIVAREAETIKEKQMDRFAIDVGRTEIVVYASPMTGRLYTFGQKDVVTLKKQFACRETPFLYQMTVQDVEVEEAAVTTMKTLGEVFPEQCPVFMVGNPHYGAQGKVVNVLPDDARVRIVLDVTEEPDFTQMSRQGGKDEYISNVRAAQYIGLDAHLMSRITGSIFVERSGDAGGQKGKVNIGLNLKFTKRMEEVPGFTKKFEKGWFYSWKCVHQVEDYVTTFQDLWSAIQTLRDEKDVFPEEKLFPEGSTKTLADVTEYLQKLPCTKAPRMPFGSQILEEEKVKEIEKMTAHLNKAAQQVKMKVKPRLLFRPLANQGTLVPDPDANFQLYDRVVVVKTGYSVPFGQRGTLIGMPSTEDGGYSPHSLYDVVFDKPFPGGIILRCSQSRGYRVPGSAMLNLTFGEFRKNFGPPNNLSSGSTSSLSGGYNNNSTAARPWGGKGLLGALPGTAFPQHHPAAGAASAPYQRNHQLNQPVRWDSRGQPLFGKVFGLQDQVRPGQAVPPQPQFVTPKVQGAQPPVKATRTQDNLTKVDNQEFDSLWKNLQSHQHSKQGSGRSSGGNRDTDILKQAAYALPSSSSHPTSDVTANSHHVSSNLVRTHPPDSRASPRLLHPIPQRLSQSSALSSAHVLSSSSTSPASHAAPPVTVLQRSSSSAEENRNPSKDSAVPAIVQSLFDSATKTMSYKPQLKAEDSSSAPTPENEEFLAMFNSLKTQSAGMLKASKETKVSKKAETFPEADSSPLPEKLADAKPSPKSQADLDLKQLLKIGVAGEAPRHDPGSPRLSVSPSSVAAPAGQVSPRLAVTSEPGLMYNRQVSLKELFEEANKQKQQQQQQQPQQAQQQINIHEPPPILGTARPVNKKDPILELKAFCQAAFQKEEHFDFKLQAKQNGYIATVTLPNGQKYEGSLCSSKQEAAISAASMALLCLRTSQTSVSHPVITNSMPGAGHHGNAASRFSAFRAIGIPGPNPSLVSHGGVNAAMAAQSQGPMPPVLLTPPHFFSQPPPALPQSTLHQLIQRQQQQQHHQQQQQQQAQPVSHLTQNRYVSLPPPSALHQRLQHPPPSHFQVSPTSMQADRFTANYSTQAPEPKASETPPCGIITATQSGSAQVNSGSAGSSAPVGQRFIPLQVTRQQKKKEAKDSSVKSPVLDPLPDPGQALTRGTEAKAEGRPDSELSQDSSSATTQAGQSCGKTLSGSTEITGSLQTDSSDSADKTVDQAKSVSPGFSASSVISEEDVVSKSPVSSKSPSVPATSRVEVKSSPVTDGVKAPSVVPVTKPAQKKKSRLAANFGQRR